MKRALVFSLMLVVVAPGLLLAQQATPSLAEVARAEEARRKTAKKATRVLTNSNLAVVDPVVSGPPTTVATGATKPPANASPTISGGKAEPMDPGAKKDQAHWQGRISNARTELSRTQMFAESLQTRINSLKTDFVNRDNRVEREKIQVDLNTALAELERLKKEIDEKTKGIAAIEDEARRAGVPPGWLRPPV